MKCLCRDWFPIDYPDTWYQEITSNPRFFSLAATLQGSIIGLIVAETKELGQLAKEDRSLLANCFLSNTKVGNCLKKTIFYTHSTGRIHPLTRRVPDTQEAGYREPPAGPAHLLPKQQPKYLRQGPLPSCPHHQYSGHYLL